jgi:threonine/homoserine/homoserine lactone efflux protein
VDRQDQIDTEVVRPVRPRTAAQEIARAIAGVITGVGAVLVFALSMVVGLSLLALLLVPLTGALVLIGVVFACVLAWEAMSMWLSSFRTRRRLKKLRREKQRLNDATERCLADLQYPKNGLTK